MAAWLGWLTGRDTGALAIRRVHVDLWAATQLDAGAAESSVRRRLSALSSFYRYCAAMPFDQSRADGFLHYRLIPLLGMAVGELFALDILADHCARAGVYEGLFVAAPIQKTGGVGSPANAVALL